MTRVLDFRFVVVRDGADYGELYALDGSAPTIRMDEKGEIKTSLSGAFLNQDDGIDWMRDAIRPELIIDGTAHPLGSFLPATVRYSENEAVRSVQIEAYDRCWVLKDTKTENPYYIAAGTNYISAIEALLTDAGIALISATPTESVLAEEREDWNTGTSYLTIINQLLGEINYKELWFNADGLAVLEPAAIPSAANIEHTLDDTKVQSLLIPSINRETDIYQSPNVFVCVCSNADKDAPMIATSENTNPQSPLAIQRRGRRIVQVTNVDNIADQTALQAYADRQRNESMITGETITVSTGLLPGFGVNDVTSLRYGEIFCVCVERAWTMQLSVGGTMQHQLDKVVINLG